MYQISLNTSQQKAVTKTRKMDEVKHILLRLCVLNLRAQILQANYQFYASLFDIYTYAKDLIKSLLITSHQKMI